MTVTYRAIWQENRSDLGIIATKVFNDWIQDRYPSLDLATESLTCTTSASQKITASGRTVVGANGNAATELSLREEGVADRWTTTLRVATGQEQWLWVDVEMVSDDLWARTNPSGPWLVRSLLHGANQGNGDPRWGVVRLNDGPIAVPPQHIKGAVVNLIISPLRECPVVVFAHDRQNGPAVTMERAQRTADALAGVVVVRVLSDGSEAVFSNQIGHEHGLEAGEARIYLPGSHPPNQHRRLDRDLVAQSPESAAEQFALLLQPAMANRRPPAAFDSALNLLRNSGNLNQAQLLKLAAEELAENQQAIEQLRTTLERTQNEVIDSIADLEERDTKIAIQLRMINSYRRKLNEISEASLRMPEEVASVAEAVTAAQQHLTGLAIPTNLGGDIAQLDQTLTSRTWGNTIWRGLLALNAYALQSNRNPGGFREWCKDGGPLVWPHSPQKYSAKESEQVHHRDDLYQHRVLPVDTRVDPSGTIFMEAHLKIAGGLLGPRLYFYDDTSGLTGKVHVGYIGAHLPTARFD